jgi:hypothetical protein
MVLGRVDVERSCSQMLTVIGVAALPFDVALGIESRLVTTRPSS